MNPAIVWIMLLLPVQPGEIVTVFPKTFATEAACQSLGSILVIQREFRCTKHAVEPVFG